MADDSYQENSAAIPAQPEEGSLKSPNRRLTSVEKARSLWQTLQQADWQAAQDRALLLDQFTGALPFRPEDLQEAGRPDQYNINFGLGAAQIRQHITSYHDLDTSVAVMARPTMERWVYDKYNNDDASMFADKLAQAFDNINHNDWDDEFFENMRLVSNMNFFGMGISYFVDDIDWRWRAGGLDEWKFPRKQRLSFGTFEYCAGQRYYSADDLIAFLGKSEENAAQRGWNIDAVKAAMEIMCTEEQYRYNFEAWIKMIKDNDLFYRQSDVQTTPVIRMLVREFDGTYTLLIFTENALPHDDDFLYEGFSEFKCASDALTIFPLEPGLGDIYSVRGYAYQLYETDLARNRFLSILIDNAQNASGNMFKAMTQEAMDDFAVVRIGNTTVLPPDFEFQQMPLPDFAQSILPIVGVLAQIGQQSTGSYEGSGGSGDTSSGDQRKTAEQIKLEATKGAEVSSAERTNYYKGKELVFNAQWKRMIDKRVSLETPGGPQVIKMKKWLMEEGVPDEVITKGVMRWVPVRSMGNGSPDVEAIKTSQLLQLSGRFDANGQNIALRQATATTLGTWDGVDAYVPLLAQPRKTVESDIAIHETIFLSECTPVPPPNPSQPPIVHLTEHIKGLDALTPNVTQAADSAPLDVANKAVTGYQLLITHCTGHMQIAGQLQPPPPELKGFAQVLAAAGNTFKQLYSVLEKRLQGMQIEQQKQQQAQQKAQFEAAVQQAAGKTNGQGQPDDGVARAQDRAYQRQIMAEVELAKANNQIKIAQDKAANDMNIARSKAGVLLDNSKIQKVADLQAQDLQNQQILNHQLLSNQADQTQQAQEAQQP